MFEVISIHMRGVKRTNQGFIKERKRIYVYIYMFTYILSFSM